MRTPSFSCPPQRAPGDAGIRVKVNLLGLQSYGAQVWRNLLSAGWAFCVLQRLEEAVAVILMWAVGRLEHLGTEEVVKANSAGLLLMGGGGGAV